MPGAPTIILCGGRGTRLAELGATVPKPMVPIGGRPILWHIMKIYAAHGSTDFVLALGWLGDVVKDFFLSYQARTRDFQVDLGSGRLTYCGDHPEADWRVTCVDTGQDSLTGTRVRLAAQNLDDGPVMITYGDGVGDVDITALLAFHRDHGRMATITAVRPPGRFGELLVDDGQVRAFEEKPQIGTGAISGGFMVLEREAIERYIPTDADVMLEREPLARLAAEGQLMAFQHDGFWQPMDTPREHDLLVGLWEAGEAPWKVWP